MPLLCQGTYRIPSQGTRVPACLLGQNAEQNPEERVACSTEFAPLPPTLSTK
jgi:hypothetical protein